MGNFLKRLEIYTTIPPTTMMVDIIVKIMAEVLSVLALATKQIKQGRFSECISTYTFPMAQCTIEKFVKKLLGKNKVDKVEAVLQRLDQLTQDEARMAIAQTLGVVHGLVGNVRVAIEGEQRLYNLLPIFLSCCCIRWQSVDTSVISFIFLLSRLTGTSQVISCKGMSNIGFPLPTHQRIMTSFGKRTMLELHHGSLRVMYWQNGKRRDPSCGSMGNVWFSICWNAANIETN